MIFSINSNLKILAAQVHKSATFFPRPLTPAHSLCPPLCAGVSAASKLLQECPAAYTLLCSHHSGGRKNWWEGRRRGMWKN